MDSSLTGQMFMLSINKGFCNDNGPCTILAGKAGVQYADGSKADTSNGVYIHHIIAADLTKKQTPWLSQCGSPTKGITNVNTMMGGTGFVGTGEDTGELPVMYTTDDGTANTGYHLKKGDTFMANIQLVNYNKVPKQVHVTWDLEWIPGIVGQDMKNALVSVTQCGGGIKTSTTGPTNTTSGKFYIMEDGKITRGRGHLHDGGERIDLFVNDKFACGSKATYGSDTSGGHSHGGAGGDVSIKTITSMSPCQGPIKVKKGDAISMVVQYDLAKHPLRKSASGAMTSAAGVMGMWGLTFEPDHAS